MSIVQRNLKGLPMAELIASPLVATSDAQRSLADSTLNFIDKMFDDDGNAKTIAFTHKTAAGKTVSVQAPLISIVNVPSLAVKTCDIDFNMEVRTATVQKNEATSSVETKASYKSWFSPVSVSMTANLSSKSSSERKTDTSAKYEVKVHAEDTGPPEGLSRILDIFESAIPRPSDLEAMADNVPENIDVDSKEDDAPL